MSVRASPAYGHTPGWPLIGRLPEVERIAQARASGQPGVVLSGPAGVGKSRLARAAVAAAERDGARPAWAQATRSAATVPLGAFADLIPDDVRSDEPLELLRGCAAALQEHGGGRPVVLGVDDAQLLDPMSAALVLQVAMAGTVFIVATVRAGEPCPDAIVSLWKDAGAVRLELGLLAEDETADLAEAIVGGPLEQAARRWAWSSSQGNALYVRELVGGAIEGGALEQVGELWRLPRRPSVSASLAELVTARMVGLGKGELELLELLALGEPLAAEELAGLVGNDALVSVEARGLVDAGALREVRLAHPLYGEVLVGELGTLRARQLRLRLADALRARAETSSGDALRVARWLMDAREPMPTALLMDAGRAANLAGDPDLGAELATLAIAAGAGAEASLLLARSHIVRKRHAEAEAVLAPLEGRFESQEDAVAYLESRAISVLFWGLQEQDAAVALLERARDWWPGQGWVRRLDPMRLQLASLMGGFSASIAVAEDILADPGLEAAVRGQLEPVLAVTLFYEGRMDEAYALAQRIRPAVPLTEQSDALALVSSSVIGLESAYDLPGLQAWMSDVLRDAVRANDHDAAGLAAITVGAVHFLAGEYIDAGRWFAEAELHLERQDTFGTLLAVRSTQTGVAHGLGDHELVAATLERCRALPAWHGPLPSLAPYVARAEGYGALAAGDPPRAQRTLLDGAREVTAMPVYAALLTYEALRAGASPAAVAADQAELARRCDTPMTRAYAAHAAGLAAGDGAAVLAAAEDFSAIGARRYAMEAAADAASRLAQAGRQDSARRAAARARDLHDARQGGTPPRIEGLGPEAAFALTAREEQLVELARRGLGNAEIADRLVLSVRTVESHIYRAMQKLGVGDRRDL
jgi:DNA-binding CsgD family transcriptional regulator